MDIIVDIIMRSLFLTSYSQSYLTMFYLCYKKRIRKSQIPSTIHTNKLMPSYDDLGIKCIINYAQLSAFIDILSSVTTTVTSYPLPLDRFDVQSPRNSQRGGPGNGARDQLCVIDYIPTA